MPKAKLHLLSVPQIDSIKPTAKDQLINDGGGLYLFVRQYKAKEWIFRYTSPITNTRRKLTLGTYPDMSLKKARSHAGTKRTLVNEGVDPLIEKQQKVNDQQSQLKEIASKQKNSVRHVFTRWVAEDLQNRKDKGKETIRIFEKDFLPLLERKPIDEVTRDEIRAVLDRLLNRGSKRMANIMLTESKQFFSYAEDEELIIQNPTRKMKKARVGGLELSRERVLNNDELLLLKNQLPKSDLKIEYQHAVYLFLATACRRQELEACSLKDIQIEKRNLFIPADRSKNTDAHNIYLSDFAIQQITAIKNLTGNEDWLFPNRQWTGSVQKGSITRQITDRQYTEDKKDLKLINRKRDKSLALPNGRWIVHDLRRTAATLMQELGIQDQVIKKCLNQRVENLITKTYQRATLVSEQQEAFEKLGSYLAGIFN